jgi:hypothetical protein
LAHDQVTLGDPRPYAMKNDRGALLSFYPEGGKLVKGANQRIAYKLTDGKGAVDAMGVAEEKTNDLSLNA